MNKDIERPDGIKGRAAKRALIAILALAAILSGVPIASAHPFLNRASPVVGTTVHDAPMQLKLWFSEPIEPAFSYVRVLDAGGHQVDKGDTALDTKDNRLLTISVAALPPGTYKVVWSVVSADTHKVEGDFIFTVAP